MDNTMLCQGSCLCGAVEISAPAISTQLHACHCSTCRKWGGGPLLSLQVEGAVNFKGEEHISLYSSSEWAERGFCKQCGTHLFYRMKHAPMYFIPVGLLNNTEQVQFESQIFIDKKPNYYCFANQTNNLTEAEVFAQFVVE